MTLEFDDQTDGESRPSHILYARFQKSSQTPSIVNFLIRIHLAKDENIARKLLLVLSIVIFVVSVYFIIGSFDGPVFINTIQK